MCKQWLIRAATLLSLVLAARFSPPAAMSEEKVAQIRTLSGLLEQALAGSPALRSLHHRGQSLESLISPAGAPEDPVIALTAADYPVNDLDAREYGMTGNEISLRQKLAYPGKRSASAGAAREESEAAKLEYEGAKLALIRQIKSEYRELLYLQNEAKIIKEQSAALDTFIAVAENNFSLGRGPLTDALALKQELSVLQIRAVNNLRGQQAACAAISRLLGDSSRANVFQAENLREPKLRPERLDALLLTQMALEKNPSIAARDAGIRAADHRLHLAELEIYPDLELMAGYTFRRNNAEDSGEDFVSAGVEVSLPVWQGSKQLKTISARQSEIRAERGSRAAAELELRAMIQGIVADIRALGEAGRLLSQTSLPLSESSLNAARAAYETGSEGFLSLLTLIRSRFELRVEAERTSADLFKKISELEELLGFSADALEN